MLLRKRKSFFQYLLQELNAGDKIRNYADESSWNSICFFFSLSFFLSFFQLQKKFSSSVIYFINLLFYVTFPFVMLMRHFPIIYTFFLIFFFWHSKDMIFTYRYIYEHYELIIFQSVLILWQELQLKFNIILHAFLS